MIKWQNLPIYPLDPLGDARGGLRGLETDEIDAATSFLMQPSIEGNHDPRSEVYVIGVMLP